MFVSNIFDMKSKFLFPSYFKLIGCFLAIPGMIVGYLCVYHDFNIKGFNIDLGKRNDFMSSQVENLTNEVSLAGLVLGLLFIAFSKLKQEDELTAKLRLDALHWAVLINYIVFCAAELLLRLFVKIGYEPKMAFDIGGWDSDFCLYNMFTPLVIFIGRFYYLIHYKKEAFIISDIKYLSYYPYRRIAKLLTLSFFAIIIMMEVFNIPFIESMGEWIVNSPLIPLPLLMWVFSKTANEDEMTTQYRLESMQLAVYVNYILLFLANFAFYGLNFLLVMWINTISMLVFFLIRFNYVYSKSYWQVRREVKGGILS